MNEAIAQHPAHCGHCRCGQAQFTVAGAPLFRFYCHCTICQAFNGAPFADVTVFRARGLALPPGDAIRFRAHRPPPNIQRGACAKCDGPAVELVNLPLLPRLAIVPSQNLPDAPLPPAAFHMFYNRRRADANDKLPKYDGYWRSQLAFSRHLIPSLIRR